MSRPVETNPSCSSTFLSCTGDNVAQAKPRFEVDALEELFGFPGVTADKKPKCKGRVVFTDAQNPSEEDFFVQLEVKFPYQPASYGLKLQPGRRALRNDTAEAAIVP